jgi:hypothetical protein
MDAQIPTKSSAPLRSRSQAIAIKRSSREENLDEIRASAATAEYDWATWRMYNRIIDHRQKYPLNYHSNEFSSGAAISALKLEMTGSHLNLQDANENRASLLSMYQIQDYPQYGEVFELDM